MPARGCAHSCLVLSEGVFDCRRVRGCPAPPASRRWFRTRCGALDAEVFIKEGTVESLHDPVGLGVVYLRGAVVNLLELEEQLVGMAVEASAELSAIVREHNLNAPTSGLEGGNMSWFIRCTAVTGILLGYSRAHPWREWQSTAVYRYLLPLPPECRRRRCLLRPVSRYAGRRCGVRRSPERITHAIGPAPR